MGMERAGPRWTAEGHARRVLGKLVSVSHVDRSRWRRATASLRSTLTLTDHLNLSGIDRCDGCVEGAGPDL